MRLTEFAVAIARQLNGLLRAMGQTVLGPEEMGVCDSCRPRWRTRQRDVMVAEHFEFVRAWIALRRGDTELRFVPADLRAMYGGELAEAVQGRTWWREHGRHGCRRGDTCRGHRGQSAGKETV